LRERVLLAHLAARRRALVQSAGFALLPVPRSAPDLSPVELCWSKLKTPPQTAEPRSIDATEGRSVRPSIPLPQDAKGWFRHCGFYLKLTPKSL